MRQVIEKKGMLVLFTLAIGGFLFASCGDDDNDDILNNEMSYSFSSDEKNVINAIYEADWILDQQIVDHTTISFKGDSLLISHFPNEQLLGWLARLDGYAYSGNSGNYSFEYEEVNGANLGLSNVGNSNNSFYYETLLVNTSYQITLYNLINYDVQIETQDNRLTAIKDQINDKWSISWQITKIVLLRLDHGEIIGRHEQVYDPPMSLMLVTTKRIK